MIGETFKTVNAIIIVCKRCEWRSAPIDPEHREKHEDAHRLKHEKGDLKEFMAANGHKATAHVHWIDQDDSSGHVSCECGYTSRNMKECWLNDTITKHHRNVLEGME